MMRSASPGSTAPSCSSEPGGVVPYCPMDVNAPFGPTSTWEQLQFDLDVLSDVEQLDMIGRIARSL